jgi:hypothetical protein
MNKLIRALPLLLALAIPALAHAANVDDVPLWSKTRLGVTFGVSRVWVENTGPVTVDPFWEANVNGAYSFDNFAVVGQVAKSLEADDYNLKLGVRFRLIQNGKLFGMF